MYVARILAGALVALSLVPALVSADVVSELHILPSGAFSAKNLTVIQKSNSTLFCRATWGFAFIRITVITNASTTVTKNHGEIATVGDVSTGDIIDIEGTFPTASETVTVQASSIRDQALERESKTFSGTIQSIDPSLASFTLLNKSATTSIVLTGAGIKKGVRTIAPNELAAGDKILSASGTYDYPSNTLTATAVEVFQNKAIFAPKNFQGTLKSISGTTLPTTLIITVDGTDYTAYLSASTGVLNNAKKPAKLVRFAAGDTVRIYGATRESNLSEIDAEVLRDLNF